MQLIALVVTLTHELTTKSINISIATIVKRTD